MTSILTQQIALLTIGVFNLAIASYVLWKNPRSIINRSFFLFVFGIATWITGIVLMHITGSFVFDKVIFSSAIPMFWGLVLFAKVFPHGELPSQKFYLVFVPLLAIAVLIPFSVFVTNIVIDEAGLIQPTIGPALPLFAIIIISYFILSIFFVSKNFLRMTGKHKIQLQYLATGIGVLVGGIIVFDTLLPLGGIYQFNLLGPASSIAFVGLTAYAIVRHQLMDIRIVIQRGLIFVTSLSIIIGFYLMAVSFLGLFFQQATHAAVLLSGAITTVLGIFGVPYIDRYFRKITDKIFFKDKYDYSQVIHKLSKALNENIELDDLLIQVSRELRQAFKVTKVFFFLTPDNALFNDVEGKIVPYNPHFPKDYFEERLQHPPVIVQTEISSLLEEDTLSSTWKETLIYLQKRCEEFDVGITSLIAIDNKVTGLLILGHKKSGDIYTREDIMLIQTFCSQAAVALEKARLYEKEKGHALELECKVKERTKQLEQVQENQRQMMLDISHGLQTPLTVVKGELGFLKDKLQDDKKIDTFEKSIDDISTFIYDLLKLADIETSGKNLKKEPINLSIFLKHVTDYVKVLAKDKHITVTENIADDIIVCGTKEKLEELVVNLASNAVKYMKDKGKREIHITLTRSGEHAKLTVADTGIGMTEKDLPHIFSRFYRTKISKDKGVSGTGLGLAIAKAITHKHGGTIAAQSTLGEGTTFTVLLPLYTKTIPFEARSGA